MLFNTVAVYSVMVPDTCVILVPLNLSDLWGYRYFEGADTTHYDLEIPSQLRLSNLAYEEVVAEEVGCYKLHIPSIIVDSDHLLMMV